MRGHSHSIRTLSIYAALAAFGCLTAVAGSRAVGSMPDGILDRDVAASIYGAACGGGGGKDCGPASHNCDTTGCGATTTCAKYGNGSTCRQLASGGASVNDCAASQAGGKCCQSCSGNCTYYWSGYTDEDGDCSGCSDDSFPCGGATCTTYTCTP